MRRILALGLCVLVAACAGDVPGSLTAPSKTDGGASQMQVQGSRHAPFSGSLAVIAAECTPTLTVTEGNLAPGGLTEFVVTSGSGSVTVDPNNSGTGLQSLTVVNATNAVVTVPAFTPGTKNPVVVTFTTVDPSQAVVFNLRAASTFHAANIRANCAAPCTPTLTVTEGNLFSGGLIEFVVTSGPGSVTVDPNNAGTGLQSLTVVGTPTNAVVTIPAFTPGTKNPVVVTFTVINPLLAVDFSLRAASTFHAANIRAQCAAAPNGL